MSIPFARFVNTPMKMIFLLVMASSLLLSGSAFSGGIPNSHRASKAIASVEAELKQALLIKGLVYGAPIFVRIFKKSHSLEVWLEAKNGQFKLFRRYRICSFSGALGPKLKEGDGQSPEGFYHVKANQLNPWSAYHLSFNLGFPNAYDRAHQRTGSALMVHGNCVSIGCYAMTDAYINEIYALAVAALRAGQPFFRVHIFPFPLEVQTLAAYQNDPWYDFWLNLKEGYDFFEQHQQPPNVKVKHGQYTFH